MVEIHISQTRIVDANISLIKGIISSFFQALSNVIRLDTCLLVQVYLAVKKVLVMVLH